jgi:hypothetical protein
LTNQVITSLAPVGGGRLFASGRIGQLWQWRVGDAQATAMPSADLGGPTVLYIVQPAPSARPELWVGSNLGLYRGHEFGWVERL